MLNKLNIIKNTLVTFICFYLLSLTLPHILLFITRNDILNNISYSYELLDVIQLLIILTLLYYFNKKNKIIGNIKIKVINIKLHPHLMLILVSALFFRISIDPIIWIGQDLNFERPVYDNLSDTNIDYIKNILIFFGVVILTPIIEELMFRGFIIKSLYSFKTKSKIFISSILFLLVHLPTDINSIIIIFILGMILGFIALKLGLFFAIIFHSVYNFIWYLLSIHPTDYWHLIGVLKFNYFYWCIILMALFFLTTTLKRIRINKNNY